MLRGADPTSVQGTSSEGCQPKQQPVFLEDSAAVTGVAIAGTCLGLAQYTGNAVWDAYGSIAIGGLLGCVAGFLIKRNINSLVETAMPRARLDEILRVLNADRVVR